MTAQAHQFPTDMDRLTAIAKEIQEELQTASQNALESAILIGERLIEAKKLAGHGNFIPWIEQNFHANRQQAQKYMSAAKNADKLRANVHSEWTFELNMIPTLLALPDDPDEAEETVQSTVTEELANVENPTKVQVRRAVRKHKQGQTPKRQKAIDACDLLIDKGEPLSVKAVQEIAGVGKSAAAEAIAISEASTKPAELSPLSLTAQAKLEAWQKKLEADFEYRVRTEVNKRVEELRIPALEEKMKRLTGMLSWPQFSVMRKAEYNKIVKCLHPDHINSRTGQEMAEAFDIFTHYKLKFVNDDEERRTTLRELHSSMPKSLGEMLARKATRT